MAIYDVVHSLSVPIYTIAVYYLFNIFFGHPVNKSLETLAYVGFTLFQIGFYFLTTVPIMNFLFTVTACVLLSLNYKCRVMKRIFNSMCIVIIIITMETVIVFSFLNIDTNMFETSEFQSSILIITIRITLLIFSYSIYRFHKTKSQDYRIPTYHYILQILVLIGIFFLYLTSINKSDISSTAVLINSIALGLVILIVISSNEKIHHSLNLYVEKQTLLEQNRSYENQNKIIDQSNQNTSAIKHDMKNHLISLRTLNKKNDRKRIDEYIETLLNEIDIKKKYVNSSNYIIDSLLNFKLQSLNEMTDNITVEVSVPNELNISPYDLTVVLGNLIDNSIEALKEIEKNRRLNIQIKFEKGSLIILMENTYSGNIWALEKKIKETKKPQRLAKRGYGLENVRRIVEDCSGTISIDYSEQIFSVVVLLPYAEK